MNSEVRVLKAGEQSVLERVAPEVFDEAIDAHAAQLFLADPRHHLAVAIDAGVVVGFASGVHYFHPDKPQPELFVNEVGVAPSHQGRGLGKAILACLLQHGRALGCAQAWVLTDRSNAPAMRLYAGGGGRESSSDQVMFSFALTEPER
jgi:ribosomal protein S18 acetylase RimI-like enzyme